MKWIMWVLLLVLGLSGVLLAGCAGQRAKADVKETLMNETTMPAGSIAPLDAAVPARLETATFALG